MAIVSRSKAVQSVPEALERTYRALFEASPDVILVQDPSGKVMDINPRAARITGYAPKQLLRMNVPRDLVVPEDAAKARRMLDEVRDGRVRQYEIRWRTKDARVVEFDVISVPLFMPGHERAWTFCTLRDVTGRRETERELRESEKRLHQIIATLPVGLAVTDRTGDIVMANAMMKRIWGEVITSGPDRRARSKGYWHDGGRRIEAQEWASIRAVREGQTSLGELIDIENFEGLHKTVQNSAAPIRSEDGQIVGAVIVNEDVTARVRAESELRSALEELKALSLKLVEVQETERQELSRELHDRIGQNLTALGINLETVTTRLGEPDPDIASRLQDSRDLIKTTFDAVVDLLAELRPPMLDDIGLPAALQWYGEQFSARTGIELSIVADGARRLDAQSEIVLFRIAQEALNNVARHARARHVYVKLASSKAEHILSISDDGMGVGTADERRRAANGFGIVTMRERARAIGGRLEVRRRPEGGTSVIVRVKSTSATRESR